VPIRDLVALFRARVGDERDKAELRQLCDKWTVVVEWPPGEGGEKCLALKPWMAGARLGGGGGGMAAGGGGKAAAAATGEEEEEEEGGR
jgi:hypothetical protein